MAECLRANVKPKFSNDFDAAAPSSLSELAAEIATSEDTIRRDLRQLASDGRIQRVHGGAVLVAPAAADYSTRTTVATSAKLAVARAAVALIQPGQTVFLDGGTTTAAMCRSIPSSIDITVVTHTCRRSHSNLSTVPRYGSFSSAAPCTGTHSSRAGALAAEYINTLHIDTFFMGVTGVHPVHGLTTGDAEEAAIKRSISRRAADTYVLASSEKVGAASPHHVIDFAHVTAAITDERNTRTLNALRKAGLVIMPVAR